MSRLRSQAQLYDYLDREFAWRLKELANLRVAMRRVDEIAEKSVVRATVCLAYAHWEGFIRCAALAYLEFVGLQRLKYNELASCFVVFGVKTHIHALIESRRAGITISAVEFFRNNMEQRAEISLPSLIDTESNLSSTAFENLVMTIGIDPGRSLHVIIKLTRSCCAAETRLHTASTLILTRKSVANWSKTSSRCCDNSRIP